MNTYDTALLVFILCCTVIGVAAIAMVCSIVDSAIKGSTEARATLLLFGIAAVCCGLIWSSEVLFK